MPFTASPEKTAQLLRYLFEEASLGIAVEDLEGKLLLANPALCSMLGFSKEELCGMNCSEFTNPQDSQDDWALFQKLRAGLIDRYSLEKRYVRKDGAQIWGRLNVSLLKNSDGEPPLVFAFVEEVTDHKRTEEALRESEERFRLAAQAGKMFAYEWDAATDVIVRSEEYARILGEDKAAGTTGQQAMAKVHPDDRERLRAAMAELSPDKPYLQISYRTVRPDDTVIWIERNSRAFFDEQSRILRIIGMVRDITERKQAEEALSGVSRRLIEAQEQERARIARDLHDDVAQRLALLAIELEQVQQNPSVRPPEVRNRIDNLRKQTLEIVNDVQTLSHELHSSKLEYLGIVAAMRSFCKELGEQRKVQIDFKSHDLPTPLPLEISLSLFRVLQEALHNAVKHSGAGHFEVHLWGTSSEIHLAVSDFGGGFDTEAAMKGRGLGITSMKERLRLVNGDLSINSQPKRGTTVHARVPLNSESNLLRPARIKSDSYGTDRRPPA
ncbi:MAG TPA: PAS domain S-box protein [Terriglobales bacterium]|nr:PAS domain S-box protein [Terriglobales bacterium]